jgi:elongation factor 1-gamma
MKLYANIGNPRANKILAAAAAAETSVTLVHTPIADTKTKEFLAKNPNGKVPVLEIKENVFLYESNAILRHIGRIGRAKGLVGANEIEEAQVDQWLDWAATELEPTLWKRLGPVFGWAAYNEEDNKKAGQDNMKLLQILNTHFATHTHLVGTRTTIADIHVASSLTLAFKFLYEEKYRKSFANLTKWFEAFSQEAFFVQAWGKVRLCVT